MLRLLMEAMSEPRNQNCSQGGSDHLTERTRRELSGSRTVLLLLRSRHGGCEAVRNILASNRRWTIVGDAGSADQAITLAHRAMPDLILVALDLADGPLAELIGRFQRQSPGSRMVAFSETELGLRQQELERDGRLSRVLWRDVDTTRLEAVLETSVLGIRAVSADIPPSGSGAPRRPPARPLIAELTERQREVAKRLRGGQSQRHIASAMHLHLRTIQAAVRQLKIATNTHTLAELIDALRDVDLGDVADHRE